ncbi:serine O-acetyltransferase [Flavobacterium suncheonense]|uniref:Serine acetyltransferase n=1 Tax=Flavobacterium suncheonense GH29-5 = DSM 17707 TaxID=1121899 RepID=A0A0A2MMA1_9FLAO|nr:serine acetyltransferase [Flavobacterium suncheonense]KGO89420.1 serine acetyltransferase [Flavobacterium suncheonense GH29-5 = DSM 17707]
MLLSDYRKYKKYGGNFISIVFFTQGFWVIFQYRTANFIYRKISIPGLRHLLLFVCLIWQKMLEILTGISIPASVQIGHSFYIGHFGGIILNANSKIGDNCNISQGVTIGVSGLGEKRGVPVIGNNVYIAPNSVVAGKIIVGDDVLIGACSLVNKDVESGSVMLGNPAVKISEKGSKGYI